MGLQQLPSSPFQHVMDMYEFYASEFNSLNKLYEDELNFMNECGKKLSALLFKNNL